MQNVGVTITDVDAFRADKTMQNMGVWRRSFPVIDFISRVSLWRPLGTYSMGPNVDRKSTRLNSSHLGISYAVFCLKNKKPTLSLRPNHTPTPHRPICPYVTVLL